MKYLIPMPEAENPYGTNCGSFPGTIAPEIVGELTSSEDIPGIKITTDVEQWGSGVYMGSGIEAEALYNGFDI